MKLIIIITGLVLLVPDRDNGQLHLLFPTVNLSEPGAMQHFPRIEYRTAVGRESVYLEGWRLDLAGVARAGKAPGLPAEVAPLDNVFARGVPRRWVSGNPSREVAGQVTLPWPEFGKSVDNAGWAVVIGTQLEEATLTNEVELHYDNIGAATNWTLFSLPQGPGGSDVLTAWKPNAGVDTIRVLNLPFGEEQELGLGEEGVHFQAYVDLLRLPGEHARQRPRVYLVTAPAGSPFNCMLAEAPIRP